MNRTARYLPAIAVAAFVASLLLGLFLPVYTDEVGWRLQERAALDGGYDIMMNDLCGPNTIAAPPMFMMPVRYASALLNTWFADPFHVRLSGVFYALVWVALLTRLMGRIARDSGERTLFLTLAFALLGIGTLPLLLVLSRPEQPILLCMTTALILARPRAMPPSDGQRRVPDWMRPIGVVVLGAIALSYHPKAVLYIPLFALCTLFSTQAPQTRLIRGIALTLLLVCTVSASAYWTGRFRCTGDPVLSAHLSSQNMAMAVCSQHGWQGRMATAVKGAYPSGYFSLVAPKNKPMSNWVAANQISVKNHRRWRLVIQIIWNGAMVLGLACLLDAARRRKRRREFWREAVLPVVFAGMMFLWGASQFSKNVYEATTILPLALLFVIYAIAAARFDERKLALLGRMAVPVVILSLCSQLAVAAIYGPSLWQASKSSGYIEGQPYSVAVFHYDKVRSDIAGAARECHIGDGRRAQRLLLDDVTYFAQMQSYRPFHRLGVLSHWKGRITDPLAYLRARGSDGILVGCRFLDANMLKRAKRAGDICCLAPPNW